MLVVDWSVMGNISGALSLLIELTGEAWGAAWGLRMRVGQGYMAWCKGTYITSGGRRAIARAEERMPAIVGFRV